MIYIYITCDTSYAVTMVTGDCGPICSSCAHRTKMAGMMLDSVSTKVTVKDDSGDRAQQASDECFQSANETEDIAQRQHVSYPPLCVRHNYFTKTIKMPKFMRAQNDKRVS